MKIRHCIIISIFTFIIGVFVGHISFTVKKANRDKLLESGIPNNQIGDSTEKLKVLVLSKGDIQAYNALRIRYLDVHHYEEEFLIYSIIMANKYNCPIAYYYTYRNLVSIFERYNNTGRIDENTRELALTYLKKGAEMGETNCVSTLSDLYQVGKYLKRDTVQGQFWERKLGNTSR